LRILATASPWNSGYLINAGDSYEVRLTVEGIYDYCCIPHESAGMVGRIIISRSRNFDPAFFKPYPDNPEKKDWRKIPEMALRNFPPVPEILKRGRIGGYDWLKRKV